MKSPRRFLLPALFVLAPLTALTVTPGNPRPSSPTSTPKVARSVISTATATRSRLRPFWFAGPDFAEAKRFTTGEPFVAEKGYSDNFFAYIHDVNGDGKNDVLVYGFPGRKRGCI